MEHMSEVYFANLRAQGVEDNVSHKIARLYKKAGLDQTFSKGDLVAVKTHFGEEGNTTYLRPQFVAKMVDLVAESGGNPFVTDSNTLYTGTRANAVDHIYIAAKHGFCYPVINAPVIIADGLKGLDQVDIPVNLKRCKSVKVGSAALAVDWAMATWAAVPATSAARVAERRDRFTVYPCPCGGDVDD